MEPQQWIELEPGKLATSPSCVGRSFQTSMGISHGCTTNTRVGAMMEQSENACFQGDADDYKDSGYADLFAVFNRHRHVLPASHVFESVKFPLFLVQLTEREAEQTPRVDEPVVELVFSGCQLLEESPRQKTVCRQVDSSLHIKRSWSGEPFIGQLIPRVIPVPDQLPVVDGR